MCFGCKKKVAFVILNSALAASGCGTWRMIRLTLIAKAASWRCCKPLIIVTDSNFPCANWDYIQDKKSL